MATAAEVRATLALIPQVAHLSAARRAAIAERMTVAHEIAEDAVLPEPAPGVRLRILGARLQVVFVEAPIADLAESPPLNARMLFGGALLFDDLRSAHHQLQALQGGWLFDLDDADLTAIGRSPAWTPAAWADLLASLSIAALLERSPAFAWLSREDRHTIARFMHLEPVRAGQTLCRASDAATRAYVVYDARVQVVRRGEGSPATLPIQGRGGLFGARALASLCATPRYGEDAQVVGEGRVAVLGPIATQRLRLERWFSSFADAIVHLDQDADRLVDGLAAHPLFAGLPRASMYLLIQGAFSALWRVENFPPSPTAQAVGLVAIRSGELLEFHYVEDAEHNARLYDHLALIRCGRAGAVLGEGSYLNDAPVASHLRARYPTHVVFFDKRRILEVFSDDPRYLANLGQRLVHYETPHIERAAFEALAVPQTLLFDPLNLTPEGPAPADLVGGLARAIEAQFAPETAVVVELVAGASAPPAGAQDRGGIQWRVVPVDAGDPTPALIAALQRAPLPTYAILLAQPGIAMAPLRTIATRVLSVNQGPTVEWPAPIPAHAPSVYTMLLPPRGELVLPFDAPAGPYPPGACRLRFEPWRPGDAGAPGAAAYEAQPATFHRWARAATDRRVGVALGGGGAWGYAHIAVLYHLEQSGVPVDMVSGTSFGSVVGAFYCALENWRSALLSDQRLVQWATNAGYLSGYFLEQLLNRQLDHARLEELPVPFFPICSDLVTASQACVFTGEVAFGVRASGAMAPLFPATKVVGHVYTDGGFTANVPAEALQTEGARLIIASNIVPAPAMSAPRFVFTNPVAQVLSDLNPIARVQAALGESQTLFNTAGQLAATLAPVYFESRRSSNLPFIFTHAERVIESAVTQPSFLASVLNAQAQWKALARCPPRVTPKPSA